MSRKWGYYPDIRRHTQNRNIIEHHISWCHNSECVAASGLLKPSSRDDVNIDPTGFENRLGRREKSYWQVPELRLDSVECWAWSERICCGGYILRGSDGLLSLKNNNGERRSKFRFHIFWCFASSKFTSGTRSKSESLQMLSKRWLVWVLRARWYGDHWLLVNSLLVAPHFSETIKIGLGI